VASFELVDLCGEGESCRVSGYLKAKEEQQMTE